MSKPKLPSQLHPDYPRGRTEETSPVRIYYPPSRESYDAFYRAHPEFSREGAFLLICPLCGNPNSHTDHMGYCCDEVGHCEWIYYGLTPDGELESEPSEPPEGTRYE